MEKKMEALDEEALDEVTGGIISGAGGAGISLGVKQSMGAQLDLDSNLLGPNAKAGLRSGLANGLGKSKVAGITQQNTTDLDSAIIYF